jgi:hypothetical protein
MGRAGLGGQQPDNINSRIKGLFYVESFGSRTSISRLSGIESLLVEGAQAEVNRFWSLRQPVGGIELPLMHFGLRSSWNFR